MLTVVTVKQLPGCQKWSFMLDEWGFEPILLEIIGDRYDKNATAMISQLPTDDWCDCVGENTISDANRARLMHISYRLEMKKVSR